MLGASAEGVSSGGKANHSGRISSDLVNVSRITGMCNAYSVGSRSQEVALNTVIWWAWAWPWPTKKSRPHGSRGADMCASSCVVSVEVLGDAYLEFAQGGRLDRFIGVDLAAKAIVHAVAKAAFLPSEEDLATVRRVKRVRTLRTLLPRGSMTKALV